MWAYLAPYGAYGLITPAKPEGNLYLKKKLPQTQNKTETLHFLSKNT